MNPPRSIPMMNRNRPKKHSQQLLRCHIQRFRPLWQHTQECIQDSIGPLWGMHIPMTLTMHRGQSTTLVQWPIVGTVAHLEVEDIREHVAEAAIEVVATIGKMVMVTTTTMIVIEIDPGHIQGLDLGRGQDRDLVDEDLALEVVVALDLVADHVDRAADLDHLGLDQDQGHHQDRDDPDPGQSLIVLDRKHADPSQNPKSLYRCRSLPLSIWLPLYEIQDPSPDQNQGLSLARDHDPITVIVLAIVIDRAAEDLTPRNRKMKLFPNHSGSIASYFKRTSLSRALRKSKRKFVNI